MVSLRQERKVAILESGLFKRTILSNGYDFYYRKNVITTIDLYINPDGSIHWTWSALGGLIYERIDIDYVLNKGPKKLQDFVIFNMSLFV